MKNIRTLAILLGTTSTILFACLSPTASAASASAWNAGRIIDNKIFTDKTSMTIADIQNFLNSKVGTSSYGTPGQCDTNGTKTSELGGGTRAQYGTTHNNPAPFTCLKDYYEVPKITPGPAVPASNYGGAAIPAGAESAANLIYDAAQLYNISPKVLLVTIQKESAGPLITDDWPFKSQYTYAMGAHCPDSGPNGTANCDPNYSGFSIQIAESAALLRYYLDNMSQPWWPYKKVGLNAIQFSPATACGSTNVNIENSATAALYTYTPYQPNQAALNNLYGLGDSCSAYGNRNFWRTFSDWFGSPTSVKLSGGPSAVSWGGLRIDVFSRGTDGNLWQKYYDGNAYGWGPWANLNIPIDTPPTVTSWGVGRLDIFYATVAGVLQHYWYGNGAWQAVEPLDQPSASVTIVGNPGVVSWGVGRMDIFVQGSDNALWQKIYDGTKGGWQPWAKLGGAIVTSPSVSSWAPNRLDVFATGIAGDLEHFWYANNVWTGAESLGTPSASAKLTTAPGAVSWGDARIDVFGRGSDGVLWQKWFDKTGWHTWERFTGVLSSAPSISTWAPARLDEFSTGPAGDLQHYWFGGFWGNWESFGQPIY
jgi:hypothetical protein